jgi:hypothetical protein
VKSAVIERLRIAFNSRIQLQAPRAKFDQAIAEVLSDVPEDECVLGPDGQIISSANWRSWVDRYRLCLDALREDFGLPGDIYQTGGGETEAGPLRHRPSSKLEGAA